MLFVRLMSIVANCEVVGEPAFSYVRPVAEIVDEAAKTLPEPRSIFSRLTLGEGSEMVMVGVAPDVSSVRLSALPGPVQFNDTVKSRRSSSGSIRSDRSDRLRRDVFANAGRFAMFACHRLLGLK